MSQDVSLQTTEQAWGHNDTGHHCWVLGAKRGVKDGGHYDLNACVTSKFLRGNPQPQGNGIRSRALRKWFGCKSRALMNGVSDIRETQRAHCLFPRVQVRLRRPPSIRKWPFLRPQICQYFDLDFWTSTTVRYAFLLFISPVYGILWKQLKHARTVGSDPTLHGLLPYRTRWGQHCRASIF
jgi:hypothetical protein